MYNYKIAIVIPCYKVKEKILAVLSNIPNWIFKIICVDDCCPDNSGKFIKENNTDPRVSVVFNTKNLGVGGASLNGFAKAKDLGADILIKIDGDGQMDLSYLESFINPIVDNEADFVKGNRFTKFTDYTKMPFLRKLGNIFFSFFNRISSGYWNIFDTTNGYLCFNAKLIEILPIKKISKDYFFESDLLNWLYIVRAKVADVPVKAIYNNEKSSINILSVIFKFPLLYIRNFFRRFFYEYCMRNPDMKFFGFFIGFVSLVFGIVYSISVWKTGVSDTPSNSGTVGLSILTLLIGINLLSLFFISDLNNYPKKNLFLLDK